MKELLSIFAVALATASVCALSVEPPGDAKESAKPAAKTEVSAPREAKVTAKSDVNAPDQARTGTEVRLPTQMTEAEMAKVIAGDDPDKSLVDHDAGCLGKKPVCKKI